MEEKVDNTQEKETPPAETTPQETTEQPASTGGDDKQDQSNAADRFDKHPRFQELNRKAKEGEEYRRRYEETLLAKAQQPQQPATTNDPYANLTPEEAQQTKEFVSKFVMPEMEKKYQPFVQEVQNEKLNKQITDAKTFAEGYGINFDEKLPEIVDYLSQNENKGRLTATEAVRNLYFNDMMGSAKSQSKVELQKQQDELNEKKKQANMQSSTVNQGAVVHGDEMARQAMTKEERKLSDIQWAIAQDKAGVRSSKVR